MGCESGLKNGRKSNGPKGLGETEKALRWLDTP